MKTKNAVIGTLLAALAIFFWGAASHLAVPEPVNPLKDPKAVTDFVDKHAPTNGIYADPRGVVMIVSFRPDRSDKAQAMGPQLAMEFATNLLQALLLLFALLHLPPTSNLRYAFHAGLMGLIAWVAVDLSYGNWYGFTPGLMAIGFLDAVIGFALAGWILGWQINKG